MTFGINIVKTSLLALMLLQPSSIIVDFGMSMTVALDPGCYLYNGTNTTIAGCKCHASCSACGYYDTPTKDYDCITCADSKIAVTPVFKDGTGICGSASQDNPCIQKSAAFGNCLEPPSENAPSPCPETENFFDSNATDNCTDSFVERACKIAKGEECSTCASKFKDVLQCFATYTDAQVKENVGWDKLCFDSTVCGFSTTSAAGSSTKFGSLAVTFIWAAAMALLATAI